MCLFTFQLVVTAPATQMIREDRDSPHSEFAGVANVFLPKVELLHSNGLLAANVEEWISLPKILL